MGHQLDFDETHTLSDLRYTVVWPIDLGGGFVVDWPDRFDAEPPPPVLEWLQAAPGDWSAHIRDWRDGDGALHLAWVYQFERQEDAALFILQFQP